MKLDSKITRFELINENRDNPREIIIYNNNMSYELQDNGETLKVFIMKEEDNE